MYWDLTSTLLVWKNSSYRDYTCLVLMICLHNFYVLMSLSSWCLLSRGSLRWSWTMATCFAAAWRHVSQPSPFLTSRVRSAEHLHICRGHLDRIFVNGLRKCERFCHCWTLTWRLARRDSRLLGRSVTSCCSQSFPHRATLELSCWATACPTTNLGRSCHSISQSHKNLHEFVLCLRMISNPFWCSVALVMAPNGSSH